MRNFYSVDCDDHLYFSAPFNYLIMCCVQVLDNQCDECRATLVVIVVDGNVVAC